MTMEIKTLLLQASQQLAPVTDTPRLEAAVLLRHSCDLSAAQLIMADQQTVTDQQQQQFEALLQSRCDGIPVAYLTGQKEFWSLDLCVTPDTLIPRAETELLVERVLACVGTRRRGTLLELGTGCGAISIALASELSDWQFCATDLNTTCLAVAAENAAKHGITSIAFVHSDWFSAVPQKAFDVIVANPPYIAWDEKPSLPREVQQEPESALFAEESGYAALRQIIEQAGDFLSSGGYLCLEHGFRQAGSVRNLLIKNNFQNLQSNRDLNDRPRVAVGQKAIFD